MIKKLTYFFSGLFPNLFVNIAFDKLANPQLRKLREHEMAVIQTAETTVFPYKGFDIKCYTWKGTKPGVLLIHGWEGQAGNFSDLVLKLQAADYTVYAFDGPSHGFSSRGKTSLFEFAELVGVLIKKFDVKKLISHSFGGVATTYSLFHNQDISIDKYLLLTTPDRFSERIADVGEQYNIHPKVIQRLKNRIENDYNIIINDQNVSDFVKHIHVKEALIIHDKNDRVIPIERSKHVQQNWPACQFKTVTNTGHFRILREEKVLEDVLLFLA